PGLMGCRSLRRGRRPHPHRAQLSHHRVGIPAPQPAHDRLAMTSFPVKSAELFTVSVRNCKLWLGIGLRISEQREGESPMPETQAVDLMTKTGPLPLTAPLNERAPASAGDDLLCLS